MKRFLMFLMAVAFVVAVPACTEDNNDNSLNTSAHSIKMIGATASVREAVRGDVVVITPVIPAGKEFIRWKVLAGGVEIGTNNRNEYVFSMPGWNVEVQAIYGNRIQVTGGEASHEKAAEGDLVLLTPDDPEEEGVKFAYWEVTEFEEEGEPTGSFVNEDPNFFVWNADEELYTFLMPSDDIAVTAVYLPINVYEEIEDPAFREYCQQFDLDYDSENPFLSLEEVASVTEIDVTRVNNSYPLYFSLSGIEYFVGLERLACANNILIMLDLSQNTELLWVDCSNNQIIDLSVAMSPNLTELYCFNNELIMLSTYNSAAGEEAPESLLKIVDCSDNKLASLDVRGNKVLKTLYCEQNALTSLNVTGCTVLETLNCSYNKLLGLNMGTCTALKSLRCDNNTLVDVLNVSSNAQLLDLSCSNNNLTGLNLAGATKLKTLSCAYNTIRQLDLTANVALTSVLCNNNLIGRTWDVSANTNLKTLYCQNNNIETLAVGSNDITVLYTDPNVEVVDVLP